MNTSANPEAGAPTYHWTEWPLTVLLSLLLAAGIWLGPGEKRELVAQGFTAISMILFIWSTYLEWRAGSLSHGFAALREGIQRGAHSPSWLLRRLPLKLVWLACIALGYWHF